VLVVTNSGPLIYLSAVGRFDLLRCLAGDASVAFEVSRSALPKARRCASRCGSGRRIVPPAAICGPLLNPQHIPCRIRRGAAAHGSASCRQPGQPRYAQSPAPAAARMPGARAAQPPRLPRPAPRASGAPRRWRRGPFGGSVALHGDRLSWFTAVRVALALIRSTQRRSWLPRVRDHRRTPRCGSRQATGTVPSRGAWSAGTCKWSR